MSVSTRRRTVVAGIAWATPAVIISAQAPAHAASGLVVTLVTTTYQASGYSLLVKDSLDTNSTVVSVTFKVTQGSQPLANTSVVVAGDAVLDGEGNYMIGFSPTSQTSAFGESPTQRTATVTTDAAGQITVKVSTATYGKVDCGQIPRSGIFTVTVNGQAFQFSYQVYDAGTKVVCP